jgi:hypothetical protein
MLFEWIAFRMLYSTVLNRLSSSVSCNKFYKHLLKNEHFSQLKLFFTLSLSSLSNKHYIAHTIVIILHFLLLTVVLKISYISERRISMKIAILQYNLYSASSATFTGAKAACRMLVKLRPESNPGSSGSTGRHRHLQRQLPK